MKINLSSHVVAQVVGDDLLLLDSTTQGVYSLALADVVDHSEGFQSLTVSKAAESVAASLCEQGLATAESAGLSRRALVGSGSAVVGAGLLALSLPTAAAASSAGGAGGDGSLSLNGFARITIFQNAAQRGLLDFYMSWPPGADVPFTADLDAETVSPAASALTVKVNGSDLVLPFLAPNGLRGLQWGIEPLPLSVLPEPIPNPVTPADLPSWWDQDVTGSFTIAGIATPFIVSFPSSGLNRRQVIDSR